MTRMGPRPRPWESRFLAKVALPDENGCMRWLGCIERRGGYGRFGVRAGDVRNAHRVSHELWNGPIPEGYDVDHLCRNRWCVAPNHLEAVTRQINLLRGVGYPAQRAKQTHCINGHEFSGDNVYRDKRNRRRCRACEHTASVAQAARNKIARRAKKRAAV